MPDSELSWLNKSDPVFAGFEGLDMGLAGRHRESPESEKEQGSEESSTAYALIATAMPRRSGILTTMQPGPCSSRRSQLSLKMQIQWSGQ